MQEQKQHHHLLPLKKEEEKKLVEAVVYSETAYGVDGAGQRYETTETVGYATPQPDYENGRKAPQRKEHLGDLRNAAPGAFALVNSAPGTFALYEKHQAKKDEVHKHRNKIEEEIATAVAVGAGGYAFRENHEKKLGI